MSHKTGKRRHMPNFASAEQLQAECEAARSCSFSATGQSVSWVYLMQYPNQRARYGIRFSVEPERSVDSEPGLVLTPMAGFRAGKCVYSATTLISLEA